MKPSEGPIATKMKNINANTQKGKYKDLSKIEEDDIKTYNERLFESAIQNENIY